MKIFVKIRKRIEIPSTPKRNPKDKDGTNSKVNVDWKPPLTVSNDHQRTSERRNEITDDAREIS
jgi:hypothetical protein